MIGGAKGIGLGLDFGIGNQLRPQNSKPYIEQAVLDSLCGVWIADQNTNESPTRDTIKNKLKDKGGDFKIQNAAYKGNSGYGLYKEDFAGRWYLYEGVNASHNRISLTDSALKNTLWIANRYNDIKDSYYVNIIGIPKNGTLVITSPWTILYNGLNKIETSGLESETLGFRISEDSINLDWSKLVIEQIPDYQGAFVTDGVDDLIVSERPVSEMLGGSNEVTVVSMIHQITKEPDDYTVTNIIKQGSRNYIRNKVKQIYITGIYGYSLKGNTTSNINILGDKNYYSIEYSKNDVLSGNFSVVGAIMEDNSIVANSSIAYYWTFIANKVLIEDQINQVIEYFNLDKYVKPDVLYNVKKQGITNDNHAQFGDKLIDYSGNGRDMQLYNIGWKGDSGIAAKEYETIKDYKYYDDIHQEVIIHNEFKYTVKSDMSNRYWALQTFVNDDIQRYITIVTDKDCYWKSSGTPINENGDRLKSVIIENPIKANVPTTVRITNINDFTVPEGYTIKQCASYPNLHRANDELTIELIPSYKNALVLDGVNDYGKVTNMPIYKDYTVVVDREILQTGKTGCSISKNNPGAFLMELGASSASQSSMVGYSFGINKVLIVNSERQFSYQSKYLYNGTTIKVGTDNDTKDMWLGTVRDLDNRLSNLAFYSAMTFPYSLSKFLIERQLKKHKLGSFYENMIQLRPKVTSNVLYAIESVTYVKSDIPAYEGEWIDKDNIQYLKVIVNLNNRIDEITKVTLNGTEGIPEQNGTIFTFKGADFKSPQVIDITIDEYVRFEDIVQPYPLMISFDDVTWGDKLKVGEYYTFYAYNIFTQITNKSVYNFGKLYFNGVEKEWHYDGIVISKSNVFTTEYEYVLDNNEPKCILSPELLRMPNESYEYLGYIPDISGHGNHGVPVNNSWDSELSGPQSDGRWKLDGVDDFIVLNDLSIGGKQVFMKFLYSGFGSLAYDQRKGGTDNFAIYVGSADKLAHNFRNSGESYIDGVLNKNIMSIGIADKIHNITAVNDIDVNAVSTRPIIGANVQGANYFTNMALYTFMLFDEISSPEKIKELNDIIGIDNSKYDVAPPYYYDAYGRSNLDLNKDMDNLGTGGVHPLVAQNIAFESTSGYGGYTFPDFSKWGVRGGNIGIDVDTETPYHIGITNMSETEQWNYSTFVDMIDITLGDSGKIKLMCDKDISFIVDLKYRKTGDTVDNTLPILDYKILANTPTEITWNYKTQEELDDLGAVGHYWYLVYFWLVKDVTYSIDMLPEYPNGLVTDGVEDYVINTTIPAFTDYTYILKRELLDSKVGSTSLVKGAQTGVGRAFISESKTNTGYMEGSFGQDNAINVQSGTITYGTKNSYNGQVITSGQEEDKNGLAIGKLWSVYNKMVFYKLMLYPKTLSNLSIQMMKNLIEEDNVIDINNPIFKK